MFICQKFFIVWEWRSRFHAVKISFSGWSMSLNSLGFLLRKKHQMVSRHELFITYPHLLTLILCNISVVSAFVQECTPAEIGCDNK